MKTIALPDMRIVAEFLPSLTKTERFVFDLIGLGATNNEISELLCISPLTARTHIKRIHDKLYIVGRARLAVASYMVKARAEGGQKEVVT